MSSASFRAALYCVPSLAVAAALAGRAFEFASPAGGYLFLAHLPLILIHLLSAPGTPRVVAAMSLYATSNASSRTRTLRLHQFWRQPQYWVRAALISLVSFAALSPYRLAAEDQLLLLVLDRSGTLNITDSAGVSADARLRERAKVMVDEWQGRVGLVAVTADGTALTEIGSSKARLRDAVDALEAPRGWGTLRDAIDLADEVRRRTPGDELIVLLSDNLDGTGDKVLREGALAQACRNGQCSHVAIGDTSAGPVALRSSRAVLPAGDTADISVLSHAAITAPVRIRARRLDDGGPPTVAVVKPGDMSTAIGLPEPGCWEVAVETGRPAIGQTAYIASRATARDVCLVQPGGENGPVLPELAGLDSALVLPYAKQSVKGISCKLLILVDPPGIEFTISPLALRSNTVEIYTRPGPSLPVSFVSHEMGGVLREIEPRLLELSAVPPDRLKGAAPLVMVADGSTELPAVTLTRDANRTLVRMATATTDGVGNRALAAITLKWLGDVEVPAADHSVSVGQVPKRAEPLCAKADEGPGVFALPTGHMVTATEIDPTIKSLRAVPSAFPDTTAQAKASRLRLIWPLVCLLAMVLIFEERRAR